MNHIDKYTMNKFNPKVPLVHESDDKLYFVNIVIGEPPVEQYLAMDTGSSVVWVRGFSKYDRMFVYNPDKSTSFRRLNCSSSECSLSLKFSCYETRDWCTFQIIYGDFIRSSVGYMGLETFGFKSSSSPDDTNTLYNVLFGVSTHAGGGFYGDTNFNGVLALGPSQASLLRSFPKKFSYCISNIHDPDSPSYLNLGGVNIDAFSTYRFTPQ